MYTSLKKKIYPCMLGGMTNLIIEVN